MIQLARDILARQSARPCSEVGSEIRALRCIVLDSNSISIVDEIVNLSRGCLGTIHQFALKTGEPHFCHISDSGKQVSFTLSDSKIVYPIFHLPLSLQAYDSTPIECSAGNTKILGADTIARYIECGFRKRTPAGSS